MRPPQVPPAGDTHPPFVWTSLSWCGPGSLTTHMERPRKSPQARCEAHCLSQTRAAATGLSQVSAQHRYGSGLSPSPEVGHDDVLATSSLWMQLNNRPAGFGSPLVSSSPLSSFLLCHQACDSSLGARHVRQPRLPPRRMAGSCPKRPHVSPGPQQLVHTPHGSLQARPAPAAQMSGSC